MSRKADLVIFGLPRWDGPFSSTALSLAIELSKDVRVFYIENPYTIKDYVTQFWKFELRKRMMALFFGINKYQKIENNNSNLINVTPHITLPINFLAKGKIYDYLSAINNFLVERSLASVKKDFAISSFIFINSYNPFYFKNIKRQNPICSIYHCVDNIEESKYIGKHGSRLERSMIMDYDLTITTSRRLLDYALKLTSHSYLLPNAADFKLFDNAKKRLTGRPIEMECVKGKIIGYIGSVDHRIDYTLLESVARNYPDWTLLLVGPLSNEYKASQLGEYSNVVAVGSKPLNELPLFVKEMDCGIIPFLLNKLTESIYPLKLNEYLAVGIPIVTTHFSKDLDDFSHFIGIAESPFDFVKLIEDEIEGDNEIKRSNRISKATTNSWENRVIEFWKIVEPYFSLYEQERRK
jgi:teichuronic acid biosynthesis glycosyltransferase TuaH